MTKLILDLCGGTGSWSKPYAESGDYNVLVVDPMEWGSDGTEWHDGRPAGASENYYWVTRDVRLFTYDDIRKYEEIYESKVHGILAAPPCTVFANSGARWPRSEAQMLEGISVMDACLRIIGLAKPVWWALENPIGKMKRYLGPPKMYFQPCDYGDPYTKKTCLWGNFNEPIKTPVEATEGSKMHLNYGGKSAATKRARSATPAGFAQAFYESNR